MTVSTATRSIPAGGAALQELAEETAAQVAAARSAQQTWRSLPVRDRARIVGGVRHVIPRVARELARRTSVASGARADEVLSAEVLPLAATCEWLERAAPRALGPRRASSGLSSWLPGGLSIEVHREPHGVALVIGPSNYPLFLPGSQALQALVSGNAVLWKPAPGSGPVAELLGEVLDHAGVPAGLLQVLGEDVACVEAALSRGVDKVLLTGSAETGGRALACAAAHLVPAAMELGGCDALVVLPGADLDLVSRAVVFALAFNGGRTCLAPRWVLAEPSTCAELGRRLAASVPGLPRRRVGVQAVGRALRLVADVQEGGGRVLAGGRASDSGDELEPTVLHAAGGVSGPPAAEVFAPVVTLCPAGAEDAVDWIARSPWGLGASIFGPERDATRLAGRLDVGVVLVNDVIAPAADPRLPTSGRGRSGFGSARGVEGLLELTRPKAVVVRRFGPRWHLRNLESAPADLLEAWLELRHGVGLLARARALLRLLGTLRRHT